MGRPDSPLFAETEKKGALALFDVDNTLVEGSSVMQFTAYLHRLRLISDDAYAQMQRDMSLPRETQEENAAFEELVVNHFYQSLAGLPADETAQEGRLFMITDYQDHIKPFAKPLVHLVGRQANLIVVSNVPKEIFAPVAFEWDFAEAYLPEGEVQNGHYTGKVKSQMANRSEKQKAVEAVKSHGYDSRVSFAFGSNAQLDSPLLDAVAHPFLIVGNNRQQAEEAIARGYTPINSQNIFPKVADRLAEVSMLTS